MLKVMRAEREDAFTLVELMIVVVIIGILAAVAIPIFSNQQKESADATLKSDLKNAALAMVTAKTSNNGKFAPFLPSFSTLSPNNEIFLDTNTSNQDEFCLVGSNKATGTTMYYSSKVGKVSAKAADCNTNLQLAGGGVAPSFQAAHGVTLTTKKALVINHPNHASQSNAALLRSYGYGTVDVIRHSSAVTAEYVADYDLIFIDYVWWAAPSYTWVDTALNRGQKILVSGNDTYASQYYIRGSFNTAAPGGFTPTYAQGLSPSFPYLFSKQAWTSNDSFRCITAVEAVTLATVDVGDSKCITMYGKNLGAAGRLVYVSYITSDTAVARSALNWLTS